MPWGPPISGRTWPQGMERAKAPCQAIFRASQTIQTKKVHLGVSPQKDINVLDDVLRFATQKAGLGGGDNALLPHARAHNRPDHMPALLRVFFTSGVLKYSMSSRGGNSSVFMYLRY